jgi:hypothetical protein
VRLRFVNRPVRHDGEQEIGAAELGAVEDRAPEGGFAQIRPGQIGVGEIGAAEIRPFQVRAAHFDRTELGAADPRALEQGSGQIGSGKVAIDDRRIAEIAAAEVAGAEIQVLDAPAGEIPSGKVDAAGGGIGAQAANLGGEIFGRKRSYQVGLPSCFLRRRIPRKIILDTESLNVKRPRRRGPKSARDVYYTHTLVKCGESADCGKWRQYQQITHLKPACAKFIRTMNTDFRIAAAIALPRRLSRARMTA